MSREYWIIYDPLTGEETGRGSGPRGAAAKQRSEGAEVARVTKSTMRQSATLHVDVRTGAVLEEQA